MISDYYNQMKKGEKLSFFVFFVVWIRHFLKFLTGHILNNSNGTFLSGKASSSAGMGTLKKANMLFLTKEAINKDKKLKMEMLMSTTDDQKNSEVIQKKNGFFSDQKGEFTISKSNFPKNALVYVNQGTISTVKSGENAIYLDYIVLGQIILVRNCPPDIVLLKL